LALGTETRKLDVPGETEYLGKGVSYCATCDGMFFKDKKVAVVGGADSAAKAALYLADICEKVTIVYRRAEMRCEPISLKKIQEKENIEIVYHSVPKEIRGEGLVNEFVVDVEGVEKVLEVDGVFVEIGATPIVDVVNCLGLELEKDYIITDKQMKTNVSGVFGAGDNTNNKFKQIVVAAGEGALAAKSAYDYLRFGK
jgi:thioredoxin reductase